MCGELGQKCEGIIPDAETNIENGNAAGPEIQHAGMGSHA